MTDKSGWLTMHFGLGLDICEANINTLEVSNCICCHLGKSRTPADINYRQTSTDILQGQSTSMQAQTIPCVLLTRSLDHSQSLALSNRTIPNNGRERGSYTGAVGLGRAIIHCRSSLWTF